MCKTVKLSIIREHEPAGIADAVLDGLTAEIVVLNEYGEIIFANKAWHDFAIDNLPLSNSKSDTTNYIGINYLAVCDQATGRNSECAATIATGIRDVIRGDLAEYSTEYCCEFNNVCTWFICRV
ncbi:MAG: hypothetical protein WC733_10165, partial [Methylophilus sp.]